MYEPGRGSVGQRRQRGHIIRNDVDIDSVSSNFEAMSMSSGKHDHDNENVYGSGWGYNQSRDNDYSSGMISHPTSSASYGSSYGYWMGADQQPYGAPQSEPTYGQLYPSYEPVGTTPGFVALRRMYSYTNTPRIGIMLEFPTQKYEWHVRQFLDGGYNSVYTWVGYCEAVKIQESGMEVDQPRHLFMY
ncbi:hypothetical protein IFM89_030529 [Coptis chinensis]|uniref:Uncharacterized protein n=1 Tax=Coptis chinensis TaxID=261450 RepID=A0A835HN18_9MAGN|nr:hypothetical protein IFM89_030529 [Coptis chinensis]